MNRIPSDNYITSKDYHSLFNYIFKDKLDIVCFIDYKGYKPEKYQTIALIRNIEVSINIGCIGICFDTISMLNKRQSEIFMNFLDSCRELNLEYIRPNKVEENDKQRRL